MKKEKNYLKKSHLLLLLSLFTYMTGMSQTPEEIPNPDGTDYFFGVKQSETSAFIAYNDDGFESSFYLFDGENLGDSYNFLPLTDIFYSHSSNDVDYYTSFSDEGVLLYYNNITNETGSITIPSGHEGPTYLTDYEGLSYFYAGILGEEAFLYSFDGTTFTNIESPPGLLLGGFFGKVNGKLLFNTIDLEATLDIFFSFDGTDFELLDSGLDKRFIPNFERNNPYLIYKDTLTNISSLHYFDGTSSLTEIPNPEGTNLMFITQGRSENTVFLTYQESEDEDAPYEFYSYNGSTMVAHTDVEADFVGERYLNTYENYSYILFSNLVTGNSELYVYDEVERTLSMIAHPSDPDLVFYTSIGELDGILYLNYSDPETFSGNLFKTELGSDVSVMVETDTYGLDVSLRQTNANDKLFWSFVDPVTFNYTLMYFNGSELSQIPNPDGVSFDQFQFKFENPTDGSEDLFLTYVDDSYFRSLYKLTNGVLSLVEATTFDVSVYPNPSSDVVKVDFNNNKVNECELSLYTMSGKCVLKTNYTNMKSTTLDISNLTSGIYLLYGNTNEGDFQEKIIIE